jgi:AraC-like DNA-binding protein
MIIIPLLIAVFLTTYFKIAKKASSSYRYVAFYCFLFVLILSSIYLVTEDKNTLFNDWIVNFFALLFYVALISIPVSFYHYIRSLSNSITHKDKTWKGYGLQILLLVVNICCFLYLTVVKDETSFMFQVASDVMNYSNYIAILFIFPILTLFYSYKTILYYRKQLREPHIQTTYKNKFSKGWMLLDIFSYVVFILFVYLILTINISGTLFTIVFNSFVSFYLLFIGYRAMNTTYEFKNMAATVTAAQGRGHFDAAVFKDNYNAIDSARTETIKTNLTSIMENEKPYLNELLTINQLSKSVQSNSKYVSHTLNSCFGQNFSAYVNSYRIGEAKRLLCQKEYDLYTIEALSKMAGFKSKSVFNTLFRTQYNMTPSQYRKKHSLSATD